MVLTGLDSKGVKNGLLDMRKSEAVEDATRVFGPRSTWSGGQDARVLVVRSNGILPQSIWVSPSEFLWLSYSVVDYGISGQNILKVPSTVPSPLHESFTQTSCSPRSLPPPQEGRHHRQAHPTPPLAPAASGGLPADLARGDVSG